jgi:1-deoxy-D-xylulose-5-phosphate synthase
MIPNFVVMAPKDENELRDMLYTAIEYEDGPIALRYPRGSAQGVELLKGFREIPIGKAEILREGQDITLIGIGNMVPVCMEAADKLAESGIEATVINARFVKPLDRDLIAEWSRKTGRVITVEENVLMGGFGSAVLELLDLEGLLDGGTEDAEDVTPVEVVRIGLPDKFIQHGTQKELRKHYGLTVDDIYERARSMVGKVRLSVVGSEPVKEIEPERPSQSGAIPE